MLWAFPCPHVHGKALIIKRNATAAMVDFQVTSQKRMEPNEHLSSVPLISQPIVNAGTCDHERGSGFQMGATNQEEIQRW